MRWPRSGASIPVTVIAGFDQIRLRMLPVPIGVTPSSSAGLLTQPATPDTPGVSLSPPVSPSTATEPSRSCRVASSWIMASIASGTAPPNMPECEACSRVRTVSLNVTFPRSRHGERRGVDVPVVRVGDDDDVGGEGVLVVEQEVLEGAGAELLLPLDEQHQAEIEVRADRLDERADGGDVRQHAGLVVGGAAAVEPVAAHRRLERRRLPVLVLALRLHVVVRVEQHRRLAAVAAPGGPAPPVARGCRRSRCGRA